MRNDDAEIDVERRADAGLQREFAEAEGADLEQALKDTRDNGRTTVIVIDTDPLATTQEGGHWWDVAVPEVSPRSEVNKAREAYVKALASQSIG